MFDDNIPADISIETLIAEALKIAPAALRSLSVISKDFDAPRRQIAYRLSSSIDAQKMFAGRDLEDFERVLQPSLNEIEQGRVTEVLTDECSMSGRWVNHRLTDKAAELRDTIAPLAKLHYLLVTIRNGLQAEKIAGSLS